MKATCEKKVLQEACLLSEKIAGKNPTLPILSSVLISTTNKRLVFFSTNLEMGLEVSIPAQIEKEGKVALPAKLFSGFVSALPNIDKIKLEVLNNSLVLTTPNSSTTIKGYPIEDFPILPKIKEKKSLNLSVIDFMTGLRSVYYSMFLSEIKPEINSVFVFSHRGLPLTFVATDSFRLSEKTIPYNFSDSLNFLMPHRSVMEVLKIFENIEGELNIKIDENNLVLESGNIKFTSRLVDGNFPDYKQIIPKEFSNTITVEKNQLRDALRSASVFCGKLNELKVKIYEGENFIEFQTNNPDLGEHTVSVVGQSEGGDLTIVFNHRYLIDCLASIKSEKVVFKFAGAGKPLFVSGLNDSSFGYLVMPMKNF